MKKAELIETLWNVNFFALLYATLSTIRINRNIVECKCIQGIWVNTDVCRELIETLWNVNYITEEQAQKINEGINRNIVECK